MSFFNQKTLFYLLNYLSSWLLIIYIKALKRHKRPQFDENKNEDILGFNNYNSDGYISLLFFLY